MPKISVIGSGRVGSMTAFLVALNDLADVSLVDIIENLPQGESLDIMHSASSGFGVKVSGSNDFSEIEGSDIVVNTAGLARKPGMDRLDLLHKNVKIVGSVAEQIKRHAPDSIVIQVSNPMDAMNRVMLNGTGFPKERVMGMGGMLDSQRFSLYLSEELKARPNEVRSMVIGEHGESQVLLFSQATLSGEPVLESLTEEQVGRVRKRCRNAGADVIGRKGATVFAPAMAIYKMVDNILNDRKEVMPCSVHLDGEYDASDVAIGAPALLGRSGVEKVVEIDMNDQEHDQFRQSIEKMKKVISELGS